MAEAIVCRRGRAGLCSDPLCQRPIAFVVMIASGKLLPIDRAPEPHGSVAITGKDSRDRPTGVVLSKAARETWDGPLYVPHFATCVASERFRSATKRSSG